MQETSRIIVQAPHKSTRWCVLERSQVDKKLHAVTITVSGFDAACEVAEGAPMQEQQCIGLGFLGGQGEGEIEKPWHPLTFSVGAATSIVAESITFVEKIYCEAIWCAI